MVFDSEANPWKRSVPAFFMFNMLTLLVAWIALDIIGEKQQIVNYLLIATPSASIFLFLVGFFIGEVRRVKYFTVILGIFGIMPIFVASLMPFIVFLMLSKFLFVFKIAGAFTYSLFLIFSAFKSAKNIKRVESETDYLYFQIRPCSNNNYLIDVKNMRDINSFFKKKPVAKIHEKIIPKLLPIAVLGYPLQRLVTDVGGHATTMALLSVMSIPLSLYIVARMAAGYTLWIYLIGCREKKIGGPIFLSK